MKEKNLEVCGECPEFPCPKFKDPSEYEDRETSSFPPDRKIIPNLNFIKEHGIQKFIKQQSERIGLLERMIKNFNDGRSRRLFCRAAALLDVTKLEVSLDEAARRVKADNIGPNNMKRKAKVLRELLDEVAIDEGIELKPKKPPKSS